MVRLTIYTRPGCHLCEEMKATVAAVGRRVPLHLDEVDITADDALERAYGLEIPVLLVEGKKAAKYRIEADALLRLVNDRQ